MNKPSSLETCLSPWAQAIDSAPQILVAVSGGMDSLLLLTLLGEQIDPQRIKAIHINHDLSANADQWQDLVADYCDQIGVSFYAEKVTVTASGDGIEAAAREARYAVFESMLQPGGLLFLAHHADDQVETVLYRLLRGAGPKGLAGMPALRPLGKGTLIRPFLDCRKSDLKREAQGRDLKWVEDESNVEDRFDRNYLRNRVIPVLSARWPEYAQSIIRSTALSRQADQLSKILAIEDMAALDSRAERAGWSISIEAIKSLSILRQKNILRHWSEIHHLPAPASTIIDEILSSVIDARCDACPQVVWQSQCWTRFYGRLYLLKSTSAAFQSQPVPVWKMKKPLTLADGSCLTVTSCVGKGLAATIDCVEIRYRQGGERCKPTDRAHSTTLKKLLQEYQLPPWLRDRVPLLYVKDKLVAVGDLWVCEGWSVGAGEKGLEIKWQVDSM